MISIYRKITVERFICFLKKYTNIANGVRADLNGLNVALHSNNFTPELLKDTIATIHKNTAKVSPENPIDLGNGISFLGFGKLSIQSSIEGDYHDFAQWKEVNGLVTLAYSKLGHVLFVPAIYIFSNDKPSILTWKPSFKVGNPLPDNLVADDILVLDIMDNYVEKIGNYLFNNIDDTDKLLSRVLFDIKDKYVIREDRVDIRNQIESLGYNNKIVDVISKFLFTPIMNIENNRISDLMVTKNGVFSKVSFDEFNNGEYQAVILANNIKKDHEITEVNCPNYYDYGGHTYYVDDVEWQMNENGGYSSKYRVVAEDYNPDVVDGVLFHQYAQGEGFVDTVVNIKDKLVYYAKSIIAKVKKYYEKEAMYSLFEREVFDDIVQAQIAKRLAISATFGAISGMNNGDNSLSNASSMASSAITNAVITYAVSPKKADTVEGLIKLKDFYTKEIEILKEERQKYLNAGKTRKARKADDEYWFCVDLLDRINTEEQRRIANIEKLKAAYTPTSESKVDEVYARPSKFAREYSVRDHESLGKRWINSEIYKLNRFMSEYYYLFEFVEKYPEELSLLLKKLEELNSIKFKIPNIDLNNMKKDIDGLKSKGFNSSGYKDNKYFSRPNKYNMDDSQNNKKLSFGKILYVADEINKNPKKYTKRVSEEEYNKVKDLLQKFIPFITKMRDIWKSVNEYAYGEGIFSDLGKKIDGYNKKKMKESMGNSERGKAAWRKLLRIKEPEKAVTPEPAPKEVKKTNKFYGTRLSKINMFYDDLFDSVYTFSRDGEVRYFHKDLEKYSKDRNEFFPKINKSDLINEVKEGLKREDGSFWLDYYNDVEDGAFPNDFTFSMNDEYYRSIGCFLDELTVMKQLYEKGDRIDDGEQFVSLFLNEIDNFIKDFKKWTKDWIDVNIKVRKLQVEDYYEDE